MIKQKKQWLQDVTWESVTNLNKALCQAQKLDPMVNPKTLAASQNRWEQASQQTLSLIEALELCRNAFDKSPFTFNNGNTFATVGRNLVEDQLRAVPPLDAQIIRTTIGHYIAGKVDKRELQQVLEHFASVLAHNPAVVRAGASGTAGPPLSQARPVAQG